MKKIVFVVVILLLAIFCLTSCDQQPTQYDLLNEMVSKSYSQVVINVKVANSGETNGLESSIKCTKVNDSKLMEYRLQEYAKFDVDGDTITAPNEQIVTKSGTVVVENGNTTSQTGDQVNYDFANVGELNFNFSKSCLSNSLVDARNFSADVTNVALFLGKDIPGATNVKVLVDIKTYNTITLSYTTNGSDVTITYTLG